VDNARLGAGLLLALMMSACTLLSGCSHAPRAAGAQASDGTLLLQQVSRGGVPVHTLLIEPDGTVRRAVAGGQLVRFGVLSRTELAGLHEVAAQTFEDDRATNDATANETGTLTAEFSSSVVVLATRRAGQTIRARWLSEESLALWAKALELSAAPEVE
jgi:hypothetical protein